MSLREIKNRFKMLPFAQHLDFTYRHKRCVLGSLIISNTHNALGEGICICVYFFCQLCYTTSLGTSLLTNITKITSRLLLLYLLYCKHFPAVRAVHFFQWNQQTTSKMCQMWLLNNDITSSPYPTRNTNCLLLFSHLLSALDLGEFVPSNICM